MSEQSTTDVRVWGEAQGVLKRAEELCDYRHSTYYKKEYGLPSCCMGIKYCPCEGQLEAIIEALQQARAEGGTERAADEAERSHADAGRRSKAAAVLAERYPKVAAKIRAGMRSSTWTEDLIDPGLLLDLLEREALNQQQGNTK